MAKPEWKTAVLLAYYSGLRLSDAVGLSWENVNFELRQMRYFPREAKRGLAHRPDWKKHVSGQLEVPLMPELEAHLLSLPSSDDPGAKLCPTLASNGTGGNRGLSSMFQRVMAAAGIYSDRGVERKGKGRQFKTLGFHSLRHTFVPSWRMQTFRRMCAGRSAATATRRFISVTRTWTLTRSGARSRICGHCAPK